MFQEVKELRSKCPKCGADIKASYLKPNCPKCNINMLYYKLDEQLEADAKKAKDEVDAVNRFVDMLKNSTIRTPWHIIRLILFFTPLISMCLPMLWAGHKNVSLITLIMSIINYGFDLGAIAGDTSYLLAVLSIVCVILFSIIEIICSLFSAAKKGFSRNITAWATNLSVLCILSGVAVYGFDAKVKIGLIVTFIIYILKLILHCQTAKISAQKMIAGVFVIAVIPSVLFATGFKPVESAICPATEECEISVISFNVASAFGTKLEDTDSMDRCKRFEEYIEAYSPDFIGTQEMNSYWFDELSNTLEEYNSYGVKRGGDSEERNSEMNPIFFKKSFEVVEKNTIWLSETPDIESKYTYTDENGEEAEAGCNRICTYAVLTNAGSTYILMNTHLDNASEQAREFGAGVILDEIDKLQETHQNAKLVLTGDFNETSDAEAYKLLTSELNDTTDDSKQMATYQAWGYINTGDKPIDFIFTNGKSQNYYVLNRLDNGYISDHYGIYSEINF